ncbi:hypothetical protein J6590_069987 [Homalodisca vitripennis]|nr:hypothetical protein J6590_069987 [Homalodisca vitripennis]
MRLFALFGSKLLVMEMKVGSATIRVVDGFSVLVLGADFINTAPTNLTDILGKLLMKVDDLASMVTKLSDFPNDTKIIKTEIKTIQDKLIAIEPKLHELDKRVINFKDHIDRGEDVSFDGIMAELSERN